MLEVFTRLPEGTRAELIEDQLFMSPAPTLQHQDILAELFAQLYAVVKTKNLGKVYFAPVDVFLNEQNAFQPDLIFVSKENMKILENDGIHGAPDFIVEIVSAGSRTLDLVKKKNQYEAAGVKEYWVIDPNTKICTGFQWVKGHYQSIAKEKGKFTSPLLHHSFTI